MAKYKTSSATGDVSFDTRDGKPVVAKIVWQHEFKILELLKGKPGIVPIIEMKPEGKYHRAYMEMAECDGTQAIHEPNFNFDIFIRETSAAVATLHKLNLVHNDLKLENFLKMKDGHWVLTDFGPTRKVQETINIKFTDPRFKAPWTSGDLVVQPHLDIYTLGLMYGTVYLRIQKHIEIDVPSVLLCLLERTPQQIAELENLYRKDVENENRRINSRLKDKPEDKEFHEIASNPERRTKLVFRTIRRERSTQYQKNVRENLKAFANKGDKLAQLFLDMIQDPSTHKIPTIEDIIRNYPPTS